MRSNQFLKHLGPFAFLTIGSFYTMYEFRQIDAKFPKGKANIYREDLEKLGVDKKDYQSKTTASLEEEYENMMKVIDINNWENIRGPRPYEDNSQFHEKMKKKIEERKKFLEKATKQKED